MVNISPQIVTEIEFKLGNFRVHISESGVSLYSGMQPGCSYRYLRVKNWCDDGNDYIRHPSEKDLKRYELIGKLLAKY